AVQKAWTEKIGLDPQHLVGVKLMDEGATRGWEMATLYVGLLALDAVSEKPVYRRALEHLAEAQHWQLAPRTAHADDLLLGYLYLDLYEREKKTERLAAVQARVDWLRDHPSPQSLDIRDGQERWTWCDALFMAPPVCLRLWQVTGDRSYLEFMDREWWATTDFLFSPGDGLFFRDAKFFTQQEANGEKIFWSRGNAWVLASLALMLDDLPADLPSRARYVALFQTMADRIAALQPADRLWRSSLLDPQANPNPESSSTAFFCYAFARGIRLGLLDAAKYGPIVQRTWAALQRCVHDDGRLGFVQQPGAAPGQADELSTAPYGVGAFLMAGAEVHLLQRQQATASAP
ncbi:MAG TPA: glycoside hydrolase family 88 protein, partial [Opitutus sp.]|nr:glycoside hydrolase family 88 protein [Opitutus sp.]